MESSNDFSEEAVVITFFWSQWSEEDPASELKAISLGGSNDLNYCLTLAVSLRTNDIGSRFLIELLSSRIGIKDSMLVLVSIFNGTMILLSWDSKSILQLVILTLVVSEVAWLSILELRYSILELAVPCLGDVLKC